LLNEWNFNGHIKKIIKPRFINKKLMKIWKKTNEKDFIDEKAF